MPDTYEDRLSTIIHEAVEKKLGQIPTDLSFRETEVVANVGTEGHKIFKATFKIKGQDCEMQLKTDLNDDPILAIIDGQSFFF